MIAFLRFARRLKDGLFRSPERNRRLGLRSALRVKFLALRIDSNERILFFWSGLSAFLREIQSFVHVLLMSCFYPAPRFTLHKKQIPAKAGHTVFCVVRGAWMPCPAGAFRNPISMAPRTSGKPAAWNKTQAVRIGSLTCVPPMPGMPSGGSRCGSSPIGRVNALTNNKDCESVQKTAPADLVPVHTVLLKGRLIGGRHGGAFAAHQTGSHMLSCVQSLGAECSAKPKHKTLWASRKTCTPPLAFGLAFLCAPLRARGHHPACSGSDRSQACSPLSPPPSRTQPPTPLTFSGILKSGIGGRGTMGSRLAPKRSLR